MGKNGGRKQWRRRKKAKERAAKAREIARQKREAEAEAAEQERWARLSIFSKVWERGRSAASLAAAMLLRFLERLRILLKRIYKVVVVVVAIATLVILIDTYLLASPTFGLPDPSNSSSNQVPFEIHNRSLFFDMDEVHLQCYVHIEHMVPIKGIYGGAINQVQFIEVVGDIPYNGFAQGRCDHDPDSIELWLSEGGVPVEIEDKLIRITRVWVSATYEVSPWPWHWRRESSPEVFNWLELDPPRWVRGDQHSPSVVSDMKEPPTDWGEVWRAYEEERSKR